MFQSLLKLSTKRKPEEGQGLVEYALVLVMVSVVVIVILSQLGPGIGNIFSGVVGALNGDINQGTVCAIQPWIASDPDSWDIWETNGEPFPGNYGAPWSMIDTYRSANGDVYDGAYPSCKSFGAFQP